jgi:hypothetical protein
MAARSGDVQDNSCSHAASPNCFGRFGNRPNESDRELFPKLIPMNSFGDKRSQCYRFECEAE